MVNTAVRLWTSQPTKRSIALNLLVPTEIGMRCECGAGLQKRIVRTRSVVRGESTTIYASSKLNRAGRRAARYDSGLKAHRYNQPARKRPAPHRIAPGQVACSRSRCGNLTTLHLPLVNPHSQSLAEQPPLPRNHARYDLSGNVISEYGEGCGPTCWARGYVYFNGQRIAEYANSTTYFAHNDHLGSPRLFTDVTAAYATDCYDFLPFGERNLPTSPCSSPSPPAPPPVNTSHLFTGKERDPESGLDNFGARYDSSSLGRFMSPNPIGGRPAFPQSWNGYSYVLNNPLNAVDPLGLDCVYLNNAGNGIESVDQQSNAGECAQNGGAWANGTVNNVQFDPNSNGVLLGYWTGNVDSSGNISNLQNNQVTATPGQLGPGDQIYAFAADLNQWNVINNTFKIYGAGAAIGATG